MASEKHDRVPRQRAEASLRFGKRTRARLRVEMSASGIVAVGALVSGILLSTALLVRTAGGRRVPAAERPRALPAPHRDA